jgi:cysteine desulfurase
MPHYLFLYDMLWCKQHPPITGGAYRMIYLDYNATTPLAQEVAESMRPFLQEEFGNPGSAHPLGVRAKEALQCARGQVADMLGAEHDEIVFTSGGTESNNMVVKSVAWTLRDKGRHIITSQIEHPAITNPAMFLMQNGYDVTFVPVDYHGVVDPRDIEDAVRTDTILISVMYANNETGTVEPIKEISAIARQHGILSHTDAAQAIGKIPTNVDDLGVDLLTVAGHKCYAPKGVGALYIRTGAKLEPFMHGGGQERGIRSGTENVMYAVALGAACELVSDCLAHDMPGLLHLRNRLQDQITDAIPDAVVNGHPESRLPNTLNVSFPQIIGEEILRATPELCASTGAACHARSVVLSHVLAAMGVPKEVGMGTIRLSLGRPTTEDEVDHAADRLITAVGSLRG